MKLGFLYAGQGSQHPGMGADLYAADAAFRQAMDRAQACVDFDLLSLCFQDRDGLLDRTRYTQPCMVAFAAAMTAALAARGVVPAAAAGLSLGEYAALHAAGVFSLEDAVRTVAFRGQAMEAAAEGVDSAMVAVLQLDREAVMHAAELAREMGARRCVPLRVSGPFHTPLMTPAAHALAAYLPQVPMEAPQIPVAFNVLGGIGGPEEDVRSLLVRQVRSGVRMADCIRALLALSPDALVEIGPGKVLSGFVKKIAPGFPVYAVETAQELEALADTLGR